jgi:NAD(P)-dependent dehydrogenase (short-subunit alcohol dehydrogenase family)
VGLDQLRLDGRVALVTGASRGLGPARAIALAEADAALVARSRDALAASDYVTGDVVFADGGFSAA